jgi:hypothetical protein
MKPSNYNISSCNPDTGETILFNTLYTLHSTLYGGTVEKGVRQEGKNAIIGTCSLSCTATNIGENSLKDTKRFG